ncbi:hypothetical protein ACWCQW_31210 [Streptomyces mirabilis]
MTVTPPDPPPTPPVPPPAPAGVMDKLRICAEAASTLCAMVAILISVITWQSQQDFNDKQGDFNNRQVDFNRKQQQLALKNEERQEEEYSSRVSIWNDVENFTIRDNGYTLPAYRTFLVIQNRSQAPLNQVVVVWPAMPGGKLKKKYVALNFIPPCSSVRMSEEYFSIDLGEELNAAEPPILEFADANRNSWARSASGELKKISSAVLKPYKDNLPTFYIPTGKEKTVKISEMPNCGS